MAFSPFLVKTLGGFAIKARAGDMQGMQQKKRVALIALLAAAGGEGVPRDRLLLFLSADSTEERARNALYQLVYRIRQEFGTDFIIGEAELALNRAVATSDVAELRAAAARRDFPEVVRLYDGPFLDGFSLRDAHEFDQWLETQRRELHLLYIDALQRVAIAAHHAGDNPVAIDAWRRAATADPTHPAVAVGLITTLAAAGEVPAALRHAEIYTLLVRDELGIEPDVRITAAIADIRAGEQALAPILMIAAAEPVNAVNTAPRVTAPVEARTLWSAQRVGLWLVLPAVLGGMAVGSIWRRAAQNDSSAAAESRPVSPSVGSAPLSIIATPASVAAPEPPRDLGRVLVVPFETRGGDSALAGLGRLAAQWVSGALTQAGVLDVVDGSTAADLSLGDALPRGGRNARRSELVHLATTTGARTLLVGRFLATGDSINVRASIEEAQSGRLLLTIPPFTAGKQDTKRLLEMVRSRVGAAFASLVDPRVESLIDRGSPPPSLEAYREYSAGIEAYLRGGFGPARLKAREHLSAAIRLDSSWALPYIWLIHALGTQSPQADTVVQRLATRRASLSPVDQSAVEFFEANKRGDIVGSYRAAQRASQLAPRSSWTYMRGFTALNLMRYAEARDALRELDPEHGWVRGWGSYFSVLSEAEHMLGDYRAQLKDDERAARLGIDNGLVLYWRLTALIGLGESDEVLRVIDSLIAEPPVMGPGRPPFNLAYYVTGVTSEALGHGRAELAHQLVERCVSVLRSNNATGPDAQLLVTSRARCLFQQGRLDESRAEFEKELTFAGGHTVARHFLAALAARRGDMTEARLQMFAGIAANLSANRELDSLYFVAMFAAGEGRKADAVSTLRQQPKRGPIGRLHADPLFANMYDYPPFARYVRGK